MTSAHGAATFRAGLQDVVAIINTESEAQIKLLLGIIGHRHRQRYWATGGRGD